MAPPSGSSVTSPSPTSTIESWEDEVRAYSQRHAELEPDQGGVNSEQTEIEGPQTTLTDLVHCADVAGPQDRQALRFILPSKIVFEARNAFRDSLRFCDIKAARHALENGLEKLSPAGGEQDTREWMSGKIQILGDLERYEEGRDLLSKLDKKPAATRSIATSETSTRPPTIVTESEDDADQRYLAVQEKFEFSVHVQDWQRAVDVAQELLQLDPSYFEFVNPMDRFSKCKRLLEFGLAKENLAPSKNSATALEHMREALQFYNKGCYLTHLFHEYFDHPRATVTGLDHDVSANLFASAARVCLYFDQYMSNRPPFRCAEFTPKLERQDWRHQALEFLERGRSRALLDSIVRNETLVSSRQRVLVESVILAARARINIKRKEGSSPIRTTAPPLPLPNTIPSSSTLGKKPSDEDAMMRRVKAFVNWQKAIFAALAKQNPALDSALSGSKYVGDIMEMCARIPKDTVIVEFAIATLPPKGIMVFVMTTKKIETATWQNLDLSKVRQHIMTLRNVMYQPQTRESDINPPLSQEQSAAEQAVAASFLSNLFIRPFKSIFRKKKKVIFIPSGELAHIPWAMLPPDDPLATSHAVTIVPSLSIWYRLTFRADTDSESNFTPSTPPASAGGRPRLSVVSNSPRNERDEPRDIPFSRIEALYIATQNDQLPILADKQQRNTFKSLASSTQILHVCAHGSFNPDSPLLSKIHLFSGSLTVMDLASIALNAAALVVFSSCRSGLGKPFDSGSALSFAHTLLGSGARAFIGALWPVDDAATCLLMILFYESLRDGLSPSESLRKAQAGMRSLTEKDLARLAGELMELDQRPEAREYVINLRYWLKDVLVKRDVNELREERCWAAFILMGDGSRGIYPGSGRTKDGQAGTLKERVNLKRLWKDVMTEL